MTKINKGNNIQGILVGSLPLVAQLVKNPPAMRETGVRSLAWEDPLEISWRRERLLSPVFWPREFHGLYSSWGHKEWDMTEQIHYMSNYRCAQSHLTHCDPMDCSLPGFCVHGILQSTLLEWAPICSSRGYYWPRGWPHFSFISTSVQQADSLPLSHLGSPIYKENTFLIKLHTNC